MRGRRFAGMGVLLVLAGCSCSSVTTIQRPARLTTPPIRTIQKWNPLWCLGNTDDPVPPDWYRPGARDRQWRWQLRNPFHNFTFYVVGVADQPVTRTGLHPAHVFAPGGGWNWAITRARWLPLPFVSYDCTRCRFYAGWRESGNLGLKLNFRDRGP